MPALYVASIRRLLLLRATMAVTTAVVPASTAPEFHLKTTATQRWLPQLSERTSRVLQIDGDSCANINDGNKKQLLLLLYFLSPTR